MSFQKDQVVKYANPESADEAAARFIVIEDRGDRVLVGHIGHEGLGSTECFASSNYVLAND